MKLSIVIPAFNEEAYIGKTLESIFYRPPNNLLEVIVVNNASTDRTRCVAASFLRVTVVDEPQKGLTKARQAGLRAARGEIIAYLDADTLIDEQWFNIVNKQYAEDKNLVCLSGPYIYYDIPAWQKWCVKWLYWGILGRITYFIVGYMALGGNFVAKKSALLEIGGFDSSIKFYGEDTDIARRLSTVGKVKFLQTFSVKTSGRRISKEGLLRTALRYMANYLSIVLTKKPVTKEYKDIR